MKGGAKTLPHQSLFCAESRSGGLVPPPLAGNVDGFKMGNVVDFSFVYLWDCDVVVDLDEKDGHEYVLVLLGDVSGYIRRLHGK